MRDRTSRESTTTIASDAGLRKGHGAPIFCLGAGVVVTLVQSDTQRARAWHILTTWQLPPVETKPLRARTVCGKWPIDPDAGWVHTYEPDDRGIQVPLCERCQLILSAHQKGQCH